MAQIGVTLYSNRTFRLDNPNDTIIIAGENQATTVNVTFPIEYEEYSKRVDFINIKGEKWIEPLYMPEDERNSYDPQFNKNTFVFTLPDSITIEGELLMQFIAYQVEKDIFVPFEIIKLTVEAGTNCCRKAKRNPDILVKAYEYSNNALSAARDTEAKISSAEQKASSAEEKASSAESKASSAEQKADSIEKSMENVNKTIEEIQKELENGGGSGGGSGGEFQLPTNQGETNFLAGDGTYKKVSELSNDSGAAIVQAGVGSTNDILIKRVEGVTEQTIMATGTQLQLKIINTTSNRSATILLYATGMMRMQVSSGTTTDTLEMVNGLLRFNNKKVLTEE